MCGAYESHDLYCPTCKTTTRHYTEWESECPNELWVTCEVRGLHPSGRLNFTGSRQVELKSRDPLIFR